MYPSPTSAELEAHRLDSAERDLTEALSVQQNALFYALETDDRSLIPVTCYRTAHYLIALGRHDEAMATVLNLPPAKVDAVVGRLTAGLVAAELSTCLGRHRHARRVLGEGMWETIPDRSIWFHRLLLLQWSRLMLAVDDDVFDRAGYCRDVDRLEADPLSAHLDHPTRLAINACLLALLDGDDGGSIIAQIDELEASGAGTLSGWATCQLILAKSIVIERSRSLSASIDYLQSMLQRFDAANRGLLTSPAVRLVKLSQSDGLLEQSPSLVRRLSESIPFPLNQRDLLPLFRQPGVSGKLAQSVASKMNIDNTLADGLNISARTRSIVDSYAAELAASLEPIRSAVVATPDDVAQMMSQMDTLLEQLEGHLSFAEHQVHQRRQELKSFDSTEDLPSGPPVGLGPPPEVTDDLDAALTKALRARHNMDYIIPDWLIERVAESGSERQRSELKILHLTPIYANAGAAATAAALRRLSAKDLSVVRPSFLSYYHGLHGVTLDDFGDHERSLLAAVTGLATASPDDVGIRVLLHYNTAYQCSQLGFTLAALDNLGRAVLLGGEKIFNYHLELANMCAMLGDWPNASFHYQVGSPHILPPFRRTLMLSFHALTAARNGETKAARHLLSLTKSQPHSGQAWLQSQLARALLLLAEGSVEQALEAAEATRSLAEQENSCSAQLEATVIVARCLRYQGHAHRSVKELAGAPPSPTLQREADFREELAAVLSEAGQAREAAVADLEGMEADLQLLERHLDLCLYHAELSAFFDPDVTLQHLRRCLEQLSDELAELSEMALIASHGLRGMLGVVQLAADTRTDPRLLEGEEFGSALTRIADQLDQLSQLAQAGTSATYPATQSILSLVDEIRASLAGHERLRSARRITIELDVPAQILVVKASRFLLARAIDSLLGRVITCGSPGDTIVVDVGCEGNEDQTWAVIRVDGVRQPLRMPDRPLIGEETIRTVGELGGKLTEEVDPVTRLGVITIQLPVLN